MPEEPGAGTAPGSSGSPDSGGGAGAGSGRLTSKATLITGAAGGIGSTLARGLAREGALVIAHTARPGEAEELLAGIHATGGSAAEVAGDLRDPWVVEHVVSEAHAVHGGLDLLVNNAGVMSATPFLELSAEEWHNVIATNLTGYFLVGQAVARRMAEAGGGAIVNVSSTREVQAWPGNAAYASSKAGIAMLTRAMALELAPHGVRVNSIAPGTFVTDLNRHYLEDPAFRTERQARIPMGRYGQLEELVGAVVHLGGDEAGFTTGASLMIDGGQTLW